LRIPITLTDSPFKILAVTCDNASNNDTMIAKLAEDVEKFPGAAAQTRCFAHVTNLVAKSLIKVFDAGSGDDSNGDGDNIDRELADITNGIDEEAHVAEHEDEGEDDDVACGTDGWVDEEAEMSDQERETLKEKVLPVRLALAKV
jgi:hypothetical protein